MRLLILSLYFRPDLSAGSFRTTALVESLRERVDPEAHIDVLSTLPNRYASFQADAPALEETPGLSVHRFSIGEHQSGMLDQSRAFARYARQVHTFVSNRQYDVVFATSSRLMTAVLGAHVATRKNARLYLDIRDIFAETVADVLRPPIGSLVGAVASGLERFAITRASRVNLVSAGFLDYFTPRYPSTAFSCISNGIDDDFVDPGPGAPVPTPRRAETDTIHILYAGNIGEGQGLHRIVPALAQELGSRARFVLIGDGGRRRMLEAAVAEAHLTNVDIRPPMPRDVLIDAYRQADVLFLHLNDHPAFRRVLPSKIFEYAALGKPILAGVAGYPATFLTKEVTNAAVFAPADLAGALAAMRSLKLQDTPRPAFTERFARRTLSGALADDLLSLATRPRGGA